MTLEEANKMGAAYTRLIEIGDTKVLTREVAAEKRGLESYLAEGFITYGHEFLGCWFTVRAEYEPALVALTKVVGRIRGMLGAQAQAAAKAKAVATQTEPAPAQ